MSLRRPKFSPPPPPNTSASAPSTPRRPHRPPPPIPVHVDLGPSTSKLIPKLSLPDSEHKNQPSALSVGLACSTLPSDLGSTDPNVLQEIVSCVQKEPMADEDRVVKCVLVGEERVGKTALIESYSTNGFRDHYRPTAFDNYSVRVSVDKKPVSVQLCDTSGQKSLDSLRPLSYPDADCFILVYSVVDDFSFKQVIDRWVPEIKKGNPHTPIVLVGTQIDKKWSVSPILVVPTTKGQALKRQLKASEFFECSALTQENVKAMFDSVILAGIAGKRMHPKQSKIRQGFQRLLTMTKKVF